MSTAVWHSYGHGKRLHGLWINAIDAFVNSITPRCRNPLSGMGGEQEDLGTRTCELLRALAALERITDCHRQWRARRNSSVDFDMLSCWLDPASRNDGARLGIRCIEGNIVQMPPLLASPSISTACWRQLRVWRVYWSTNNICWSRNEGVGWRESCNGRFAHPHGHHHGWPWNALTWKREIHLDSGFTSLLGINTWWTKAVEPTADMSITIFILGPGFTTTYCIHAPASCGWFPCRTFLSTTLHCIGMLFWDHKFTTYHSQATILQSSLTGLTILPVAAFRLAKNPSCPI